MFKGCTQVALDYQLIHSFMNYQVRRYQFYK